jgi:protein-S-isoprenylcysteine O-methyltransferase Ste14
MVMAREVTTRVVVIRLTGWYTFMAVLLFASAGTLKWGEAWLYLLMQGSMSTRLAFWLLKHNPDLLKQRMTFLKPSAKDWDKVIVILSTVMVVPLYCLPGLDAVRNQWSHLPFMLQCAGFMGIFLSFALIQWVMRSNPYLSRIVEIQKERGHHVITTGPYRYVRHPMYAGVIVWLMCFPLALGSWTTFIPSVYLVGLMVVRTGLEDRTLHEELDGYATYARKVRYRLIPGIW